MRYTKKDLENLIDRINIAAKTPMETYIKKENKYIAQVGNYHLDWAYGGVRLVQIQNESGGISLPANHGFLSKRETYNILYSFLAGLYAKETKK